MPVAKATIQSGCIQGPEGPCSLRKKARQGREVPPQKPDVSESRHGAPARCPWLKPQFNQAAFRGLKAPAPSGIAKAAKKQRRGFVGERGGRLRRGGVHRGSFDFAQDRLFALERRAQDDSKNRQRRNAGVLRLRLAQRARQTPLRMTASLFDRGRWTRFARPTLATMKPREDGAPGCIIEMPVAKATIQSGCIQGPEGPCSLRKDRSKGKKEEADSLRE